MKTITREDPDYNKYITIKNGNDYEVDSDIMPLGTEIECPLNQKEKIRKNTDGSCVIIKQGKFRILQKIKQY